MSTNTEATNNTYATDSAYDHAEPTSAAMPWRLAATCLLIVSFFILGSIGK